MKRMWMMVAVLLSVGVCGFAQLEKKGSATKPAETPSLRMVSIFGDHMVLQAGKEIPLWGWASPGAEVRATSISGDSFGPVKADKNGRWSLKIGQFKAGQSGTIRVSSGDETLTFTDVLVGEVWLGSGQSNMEMHVDECNDAKAEIAAANYPSIRMFTIKRAWNMYIQDDVVGEWKVCTPETVGKFSATAYFFGRALHKELKTPVGLIATSWGGATVESWVPASAMKDHKDAPSLVRRYHRKVAYAKASEAEKKKIIAASEKQRLQQDKFTVRPYADDQAYKAGIHKPGYDDRQWKPITLPDMWERQIPTMTWFDGVVWFRRTAEVPAAWAGKDAVLVSGKIDDYGAVFFNGEFVGTGLLKKKKFLEFPIPGKLVRAGTNQIALRIQDIWGWGGMNGKSITLHLKDDPTKSIDLSGDWKYKITYTPRPGPELASPQYYGKPFVASLYNAMLAPIVPYPITGAIWYQGEANIRGARQHPEYLRLVIEGWRTQWGQGDFPFLYVQLPNYRALLEKPAESMWADLRDAQRKVLAVPNTAMAVTIDIGDVEELHPPNKQEVGRRLSLGALNLAYGKTVPYRSPMVKRVSIAKNKEQATVVFEHVGKGLVAKGTMAKAFAVLGDDGRWHWAAESKIVGKDTIVVTAPAGMKIHDVRYAWARNPRAPLFNSHNLPATPFNTMHMRAEK
jgi:sialate O-acetylesterase